MWEQTGGFEDRWGQIFGGKWGDLGAGASAAPVHGAEPEPGTGCAELCRAELSKYLDIRLFASKQSESCFSTEAGEQLATTQICTGRCTAAESRL